MGRPLCHALIERVAQAVAKKVDGEHRHREERCREEGVGPRLVVRPKLATVVTRSCGNSSSTALLALLGVASGWVNATQDRAPHGCTNCNPLPYRAQAAEISHGSCVIRSIAGHRARLCHPNRRARGGPKIPRSREHVARGTARNTVSSLDLRNHACLIALREHLHLPGRKGLRSRSMRLHVRFWSTVGACLPA